MAEEGRPVASGLKELLQTWNPPVRVADDVQFSSIWPSNRPNKDETLAADVGFSSPPPPPLSIFIYTESSNRQRGIFSSRNRELNGKKSRKLYELNCSRDLKTEHLKLSTKLFVKRDLCKRHKWKKFSSKRKDCGICRVELAERRNTRAWRNK